MQNNGRGGTIRIVGVAPCTSGITREVPGADKVQFYVDPVSGLRVLVPNAASAQVLATTGNLTAHIRGADVIRSRDNLTRGSSPQCRSGSGTPSDGSEARKETRPARERRERSIDNGSPHVALRDSSQASKARRKKKIFRNSMTVPDDLCSLGESGDGLNEHSTKKSKKSKKSKRHCDIHNPRRGSAGSLPPDSRTDKHRSVDNLSILPETPPLSRVGSTEALLVCTCKPKKSKRPEPEGRSAPFPKIMSEYDKVIFNDDPLFSDLDDDDDDDPIRMEQIKNEAERYHKRAHHSDMFAAAQMVNTNTMLKFAIIGAELQNIIQVSLKRSEGEVQALTRRIRLLEEDFEQTETRLQSASEKLEEASKAADESERGRKVLENRGINDDERIQSLEKELEETILMGEEADRKYEEAARKLAVTEVDLERAEARLESAEAKILELEEELKVVGNNMKSLEISEQEASQREDSYEESIRDLTARLKDAENRATEAERTVSKLQKEVDRLEDELLAEKEKYKGISEELDQTFAELAGF